MKTISRTILGWLLALTCIPLAIAQTCTNYPEGPITIYDEMIEPGWNTNWSWGNVVITQDTAVVGKSGKYALKAQFPTAGGGIEFHTDWLNSVSTTTHTAITFMVRKEMGGNLMVGLRDFVDTTPPTVPIFVSVASYVVPAVTSMTVGKWYIVSVPISAIEPPNKVLGSVIFYTDTPGTLYLDKIELTDGFLKFPLQCSNANCVSPAVDYRVSGAYTPNGVATVVDHSMKKNDNNGYYAFGSTQYLDGIVLAWTGEKGIANGVENATNSYSIAQVACYPKNGSSGTFSVGGTYYGTSGTGTSACLASQAINYDDHPGFDYRAEDGTPVYAAAAGTVLNFGGLPCINTNLPGGTCVDWGYVGINHGNGYITQYGHLSSVSVTAGATITEGQLIGYSGHKAAPGYSVGPHLHFEVFRLKPGANASVEINYAPMDPYGWYADGLQDDPLAKISGFRNVRLWK